MSPLHQTEKCQKRLPQRLMANGYKISSLCDLPKGHNEPCKADAIEERVFDKVLPEIEEQYYPKIG